MLKLIPGFLLLSVGLSIFNVVPEGHVGISYTLGRLDTEIHDPGLFMRLPPPIVHASKVQITPQTDIIKDVKCGAGDGTLLIFPVIEIGNYLKRDYVYRTVKRFGENYDNYLVKDKVRAQINVICSRLSSQEIYIDNFDTLDDQLLHYLQEENTKEPDSGVVIQFVRMSKPVLPAQLQSNYDKIANEKTAKKIAEEANKRLAQEHTNQLMIVLAEVERKRAISEKENQILLEKKTAEEHEMTINNRIVLERARTEGESEYLRLSKMAEGNLLLHTPAYLALEHGKSILNNAKHYFGQIPQTIFMTENGKSMMNMTG